MFAGDARSHSVFWIQFRTLHNQIQSGVHIRRGTARAADYLPGVQNLAVIQRCVEKTADLFALTARPSYAQKGQDFNFLLSFVFISDFGMLA